MCVFLYQKIDLFLISNFTDYNEIDCRFQAILVIFSFAIGSACVCVRLKMVKST